MSKREADFTQRIKHTIAYKSNHTCCNPCCAKNTEQLATGIIIPIGESVRRSSGIHTVGEWLEHSEKKKTVWPVYSLGLRMTNKSFHRKWFQNIWEEIDYIAENKNIDLNRTGVIIPYSNYVAGRPQNLFWDTKTKEAADAYLELANEILRNRKRGNKI